MQEEVKARQQLQLIAKSGKCKELVDKADFISSQNSKTAIVSKDSKSKVKSDDWLGMETDQVEQLDTLLSLSAKALNKNQDNEATDASTTLGNRK